MSEQQSEICFVKSDWNSISGIHRFSHEAMATTFEIIILYEDSRYAQQAARAAFDELDKLEAELSRFIENSDISRINNLTANQSLRVGLATFECLKLCGRMQVETNGAFNITVRSLLDDWLSGDKTTDISYKEKLSFVHQGDGLELIKLNEDEHTVQRLSDSVRIDLGGFGKGYAVDQMAKMLGEWGIDIAVINGGYSSVLAVGAPRGARGWPVTLSNPCNRKQTLARLYLQDRAVSGSGLQKGRHIIDPRTDQPVEDKLAAWACTSDAGTADILSTAFMVMSLDEVERYCSSHSNVLAMLVTRGTQNKIVHFGSWKANELFK